ncbi:MAG TPA: hypothetical protein VK530_02080 [Candidatus Acidoferrum sp.]|nr:hypothetical protein [Candidatus Acidoferrum sp.]
MPEQPQNKAEELLQRHARERRERGGEFSLHPASRRLLQGEVTRQFATKHRSESRPGIASWFSAWRMVTISFGLVALLGMGGWMVFQESQPFNGKTELAKADVPPRESSRDNEGDIATKKLAEPESMPTIKEEALFTTKDFERPANRQAGGGGSIAPAAQPSSNAPRGIVSLGRMDFANVEVLDTDPLAASADTSVLSSSISVPLESNAGSVAAAPAANAPQSPAAAAQALAKNSAVQRGYRSDPSQNAFVENRADQSTPENFAVRSNQQQQQLRGGLAGNARNGAVDNVNRDSSTTLANNYVNQQAPPTPSKATEGPERELALNTFTRARRTEPFSRIQLEDKAKQSVAADMAVLARFSIEHTNEIVRVTDADGSVYEGVVSEQLTRAEDRVVASKALSDMPARFKREATLDRGRFGFRVTGTNRTLNQLVIIDGTFSSSPANKPALNREIAAQVMPAAPTIPATAPIVAGAAPVPGAAPFVLAVTNNVSSVEGTVRIGSAERLFRARRITP